MATLAVNRGKDHQTGRVEADFSYGWHHVVLGSLAKALASWTGLDRHTVEAAGETQARVKDLKDAAAHRTP